MAKGHIFLSYARRDGRQHAERIQTFLQQNNHKVFLDTDEIPGGADWTKKLDDAIVEVQAVVAILSDGSYHSPICRAEIAQAHHENKRIIPIRAHKDAKPPLTLAALNRLDLFLDGDEAKTLGQLLSALGDSPTDTAKEADDAPYTKEGIDQRMAACRATWPQRTYNFIDRARPMAALRRALLAEKDTQRVGLSAVNGQGGIGKTALARAICEDPNIQRAFPDGILWATIGQTKQDLTQTLRRMARALGLDTKEGYETEDDARQSLLTALDSRAVLLILDDIWDGAHLQPFLTEAQRCRTLFTTRSRGIVAETNAEPVPLQRMERGEALAMLESRAGRKDPDHEKLAQRLSYLPKALEIAAVHLQKGKSAEQFLKKYKRISKITKGFRDKDRDDNLAVCLTCSLDEIDEDVRELFFTIGIFPDDVLVPESVLAKLWPKMSDLDADDAEQLSEEFANWALYDRILDENGSPQIQFHDLLHEYAGEQIDEAKTHQALLDAYYPNGKRWWDTPDDGYLYAYLGRHLSAAGREDEYKQLLLEYPWIRARVEAGQVAPLFAEYDPFTESRSHRLVQSAVRQSAHVLGRDPGQLPQQALGRSLGQTDEALQAICTTARSAGVPPWLEPLRPTLEPAGSPLLATLEGHSDSVNSVAVTPDGQRAVSASYDQTLRVWDLASGRTIAVFTADAPLYSVAIAPDGRHIFAGDSRENVHFLLFHPAEDAEASTA